MREMKQYDSFKAALLETIGTADVTIQPVSGGDINCAYRLSGNGQRVFMKANREKNIDFFIAEVVGLCVIAETRMIRVPEVLAIGRDGKYGAFLLLEWSRGTPSADFFENFGRRLAEMHKAETGGIIKGFGFSMDNYIGAEKQENTPKENWTDFFRDHRLVPQLRKADYWFDSTDRKRITRLLDNLGNYLPEPDFPSLLHGDLWSGNYITGNDGEAWLIDPAVYVGHAEADLAMTELFGGFPGRFYEAYNEVNRIDAGYKDRRDLYNFYHLLNHLNLFGGWYLGEVKDIIRRYS